MQKIIVRSRFLPMSLPLRDIVARQNLSFSSHDFPVKPYGKILAKQKKLREGIQLTIRLCQWFSTSGLIWDKIWVKLSLGINRKSWVPS